MSHLSGLVLVVEGRLVVFKVNRCRAKAKTILIGKLLEKLHPDLKNYSLSVNPLLLLIAVAIAYPKTLLNLLLLLPIPFPYL